MKFVLLFLLLILVGVLFFAAAPLRPQPHPIAPPAPQQRRVSFADVRTERTFNKNTGRIIDDRVGLT